MAWETVIGLEVHVELSTKSKIFCSCTTQFGGEPNTHCCPICTGMPGTLPVLNEKVVEYAVKAGIALNCDITRYSKFDRKNYFYPDLPKAYQISQLYLPICKRGKVKINIGGREKEIRIHEIHMEEDAGKLIHDPWADATKCDYNRCGVPLIEIVSEPDFSNGEDVVTYLEKLRSTLQYLDVSDCKMQEGSMRADINLSVRKAGQKEFGVRTEMKNMNSFKAIARAIEYESKRQIEALEEGGRVVQETRRWDENKDASFAMRSKENAQDYRYFPEPDLPPLEIGEDWLENIRNNLPEMAEDKIRRYVVQFNLPEYDARMITLSKPMSEFFEEAVRLSGKPKEVANWILGEVMRLMKEEDKEFEDTAITAAALAKLIDLIDAGTINRRSAREIFAVAFKEPVDIDRYIRDHNMEQVSDTGLVSEAVAKVFAENPKSLEDYKAGKTKAFGFLIGQTMRLLKGKADPAVVNQTVQSELDKL